jgi:hypothetical protein
MFPSFPVFPVPQSPDLDQYENDLRATLARQERFANSIWRLLPAFMPQSAIDRMGLETVATLLDQFHSSFRDYLCEGVEKGLTALAVRRQNPYPSYGR